MGYRFLDDYDPQKEQKKKQAVAQKAPQLAASGSGNLKKLPQGTAPAAQSTQAMKPGQIVRTVTAAPVAAAGLTSSGGASAKLPKLEVPKLTRFTASEPQTLKLPEIKAFGAGDYTQGGKALERIAKTVAAGAAGIANGAAEIAAQFHPTSGQQSMGQFAGAGDLGRAAREFREKGTDINLSIQRQEQERKEQQLAKQQRIFAAADRLSEKEAQYQQEAKEGLGTVGRFLVDMGVTGTQMAGDALMNLVLPGSGLAMMGMRSYGQAAGEARREGKGSRQQFLAGLKSAGIEMFTEKMFGAFAGIYGKAGADKLVEKLVTKLTKNTTGQALLTWMVNAAGEGVEEVTSDLLNPLTDRLLKLDSGADHIYSIDDLAQLGYDFLLGTAMGALGGGTQLARGVRQGRAQTAEKNYYDDLLRNGLGSAQAAANAQRADAAMGRIMPAGDGLRMPQLTTYAERQAAETSRQRAATRYTAEEAAAKRKDARTFRNIIAGIDTSVSDFFERWKSGRKSHLGEKLEQLYIAPMPDNMAEEVSRIVGYHVDSRDFIVTSDDVKHVIDQHGNPAAEIAKGNIPLETWMLDALPDVVTNPDSIEPGNLGTGNKNAGKRGIVFSKAFPGGKIITIQFDNKGRGTLELNTMYAKESATLEGNGTDVPNTFTPEAAKPALSYAEKTRTSRYAMPSTQESAAPAINAQNDPPQSFSLKTSVPQAQESVNRLKMPQLVDEQGRTYEQRMAWQQIPEKQRAAFDEAQRIAQRFGARVVVSQQEDLNGSYRDGVISLNPNAANPVRKTLIHELTHHMESSGLYGEFRDKALWYVAENMGADVDSVRQAVMADYARNGVALDEDGATREIVAKFAEEKLFTDETTVRQLLAEDRNLFQRIYDWIRDMAGRLTGTSEESFLRSAEKLYAKALRETTAETGRETQMLFAGENARTANMQTLNRAQALEASGAAAEDIRRETGWFRGMDGKWRFEIDDSAMRYDRQGVTQNPDVQRKRQLEEKLLYGQLTQEETNELRALTEATRGIPGPRTLGDYIQHGALFEAYPELRDAAVVFEETEPGVNGYYNAGQNTIVLDSKLRGAPESTLVHEIQHAVQRAEGFARGSTPEYWKYKNKDGQAYRTDRQYMEAEKRGRDAFDAMPDSVQDEVRRINRAKSDQDWDEVLRLEDDIYNGPYAELYSAYDLAEFDRRSRVDYYKGANYVDLYTNTAGEIEARDAANRRSYSAEQRRLRMPNLGNANTVFAGGNMGYFAMSAEEQAGIREQLRRNSNRLNAMDVVGRVNTSAYVGLDTGKARTKLVEELGRRGYTVNRPGLGEVQFSEKEINNSLNYKEKNPAAEDARRTGFLVLRDVLKRGIEIDGHDGHKGRNYDTVTIAAPVEINGKRGNMAVVVKKTKGNRYKVHRILTPAGETFILPEMANAEMNTVGAVTNNSQLLRGSAPAINSASEFSIPNNSGNVNTEQYSTGRGLDDLAGSSDYLDALARDENMFTSDAYTLADRLYDLQLRRAQQQEAPPERPAEQVAREDLDEIAELFTDQGNFFASREDRIRETENMVADHTIEVGKSRKEKATEAWSYFYRKMVDAGHSVDKFAKAAGDPYLYQIYNQARASSSAGVSMITDAQTNVNAQKVGESLNGVFSPIRAKGEDYYRAFQLYMFDLHNIDRMSLSKNKEAAVLEATAALNEFDANHPEMRTSTEAQLARMTESLDPDVAELARERMQLLRNINKADAIKDKPVFSFDVTADVSQERARRAAQEHPEFEQYRQQVRTYIDNLMQYRVDSGLMTQADADYLKRLYPNYVPTMRKGGEQAGAGRDRNAVRIGRTVGRAEGGTADLVPLHEALGRQTMKVVREGSKNRFGQRLLDDFVRVGENSPAARYVQEAHEYEHEFTPDTLDDMSREQLTRDKTLTVFKDGKLWELTVDDTMFDALKALSPDAAESNAVTRAIRTANNLFKSLVTGYNPTFTIRNTVRDLQTAGLYTRDAAAFARNYPKALAEIKNNGQYWQMYKALGGSFSSVFDYNTGTVKEPKGRTAKLMAKIEALNMTMEQAPRLAEFMSVVEKGGTSQENLADALYAAADVTVNFGRAGTLGKVLNANYVPFLNPGIQGFDKLIRRVTETKGGREWAKLIIRAMALGVAPSLLNALLYHDDEEWDDLRDSDKDTNYLFKLGNGTWLKIPKGRELSLLGITADRIGDALRGEDVDLIATINTMGNQVAPANPLTSNIASALFEAQLFDPSSPGRTWYGGDIENQRLQSYAPGQRYDSSTDVFSKAVGGALGISPKKLNYVLDQYSGVVGDFLLPLLTPQAERGMFSKAFTVDAVTSNRLSGDFYDESDALTYAKNDGDGAAAVVSRFWSKQQSACSDLYKQIREVEASDLSDREKHRKTRELKALVNGIQKNAMAVEDTYRAAVEKNLQKGMSTDDAYRAANKDCFGAEYALQVYSKDVYEKAKNAKSNGVSYDDYYAYYFGTKGLEATDETSVTTQKFEWLQSSGMSPTSQAEIYFADMASDKVLQTQAELEISSGITAEQFYQYKVASSGMTKKAEKMQAINSLDLTAAQKDAIYYAEGWAQSTIGEAPWRSGYAGRSSGKIYNGLTAAEMLANLRQRSGGTGGSGTTYRGKVYSNGLTAAEMLANVRRLPYSR